MRLHRSLHGLSLLAILGLCFSPAPAGAALIAYEGFDYASGAALNARNGGSGWAGGWAAGNPLAFIAAAGLTFGNLSTTGGAATATAKPNPPGGGDITFEQRQLPASFGADGTTLYFGFLLRPETGFGFYGGLNLGALFIGKSGDPAPFYGIESAGANIAPSAVAPQVGETVLLVLRAQFQSGDDVFDLFVNPVAGAAEPLLANATMANFDLGAGNNVTINNAGAWTVDEIRIGTTFADVTPLAVPAPPVTLLLVGGFVTCAFIRTRNRKPGTM